MYLWELHEIIFIFLMVKPAYWIVDLFWTISISTSFYSILYFVVCKFSSLRFCQRSEPPILRGGPPLGTISMDQTVHCHKSSKIIKTSNFFDDFFAPKTVFWKNHYWVGTTTDCFEPIFGFLMQFWF